MKQNLTLKQAAATTPPVQLTDTEALIDLDRMRRYRLQRVRDELKRRDYAACVLLSPLSVRYATGVRNCAVFQTHILAGYLFVPVEGPVVYFDSEPGRNTAAQLGTIDEMRDDIYPLSYMFGGNRLDEWYARWARQIADLVDQHGAGNRRLAVERAGTRAPAALAALGVEVVDGSDVIEYARRIKSAEEVLCMNHAIAVAEDGMYRMREHCRPGVSETQLWSHLWQANTEAGGDWIECRLLSAGDRTNPWQQEASSRLIRADELVCFDTDLVGPFGYAADISRAFFSGPGRPSAYQREIYSRAWTEIQHNIGLLKPGMDFRQLTKLGYRQPERFRQQRYPVMFHGIGMSDEWPCVFYPQDGRFSFDGETEPGMCLCVESYVGEVGAREGVKLEQQVLITEDGCELLSRFPFEEQLLGGEL